jgi:GNAT superfamily N-acetyltransferase
VTIGVGKVEIVDDVAQLPLESGWLPATPAADTYLRRFLLNWAGMCAATALLHGGLVHDDPAFRLADSRRPAGFSNCATLLQPLMPDTERVTVERINAFFAFDDPARFGEVLLVSLWPTGDLRTYGWNLMGHPPVHLLPAGAVRRAVPAELRIEPVRDRAGLDAWERVAIDGYPLDALEGASPGALIPTGWLNEPRATFWVGWVGDEPVCASMAWTEHGINDVTMVATVPTARRRGYGEALTWCAAQADPALPAMLLSSDDGRPVYERMGFLPLLRLTLWYRARPE